MSEKIKTAVIGVGVGKAHIRGYLACPEAELIGICDIDEKRLRQTGEQLGIPVKNQYTDVDKLLALPELQAVSVTLPNHLHAPITIAALKAGKHVICEKPLARNAVEAQSMVDAAKQASRQLMVCFNYRFREDTRWIKSLTDQGKMGRIYFAKAGWLRNSGIPGWGGWFTQKDKAGGGPLIDLGVHVLDLTLWLMGYPKPVSVTGTTFAEFGPRGRKTWRPGGAEGKYEVEDLAAGFVRFENGSALTIETSWASQTKAGRDDYFVTLYGTEGGTELYVPNYSDHDTVKFFTDEGGHPVDVIPNIHVSGGHERAISHFVQCVQENRPPEAPGEQGVTLLKVIDGLYESARIGSEVNLT